MTSYYEVIGLNLNQSDELSQVRNNIVENADWHPTPTSNVSYVASNRLLIVADTKTAEFIESTLPEKMLCYVAIPSSKSGVAKKANAYNTAGLSVRGFLGRFQVYFDSEESVSYDEGNNLARVFGLESGLFDQVLDCSNDPLISADIKPPGYYHGLNPELREGFIASIPEMIGEFEKPKYFDYNPDICAHSRSGISGCTRCVDACPTDAIISVGETIEVNPHLCQGGGSCTAGCPTGAISYLYPKPGEQLEFLRSLVRDFHSQISGSGISLLIYDSEHGRETIESIAPKLPGHVIPFVVEEIGSAGLDLLSCAPAYGVNQVLVHVESDITEQVRNVISQNIELINAVLDQLDCQTHTITIVNTADEILKQSVPERVDSVATFAPVGDKRSIIRSALGYFHETAEQPPDSVSLPQGSLFGTVHLNVDACTLCMGCVSQCPGNALQAGGEVPALRFIEANCVQCGICTRTCPESAMELEPRLNFDHEVILRPQTLKEEEPFRCVSCGKPFATKAMITKMAEKLKDHWMFDKPDAMKRLQMCEDCRVIDMFDKEELR